MGRILPRERRARLNPGGRREARAPRFSPSRSGRGAPRIARAGRTAGPVAAAAVLALLLGAGDALADTGHSGASGHVHLTEGTACPQGCPNAASGYVEAGPGDGEIKVQWTPATTGPAVTRWQVVWRKSGDTSSSRNLPVSAREHTLSGLDPGAAYTIQLRAQRVENLSTFATSSTATGFAAGNAAAFSSAVVVGRTLTITFDETLDTGSVPAPGAFAVAVRGASRDLAAGGVAVSGATVTLTLVAAVVRGETVTVGYTKPATNPLRTAGAGGLDVATFAGQTVRTTIDKVVVSNIGQTATATNTGVGTGSPGTNWERATSFTTGAQTGGYLFRSVDVRLGGIVGVTPKVSIYSTSGGHPDTLVRTLTRQGAVTPNAVNTFAASVGGDLRLDASTTYAVVLQRTGNGTYFVGRTASDAEDAGAASGWSIADEASGRDASASGASWSSLTDVPLIAIKADVDTTAPAVASARVAGDKLTLTFSETLGAAASLANSAFAVTKRASDGSDTSVTLSSTAPAISGDSVVLTLASAVASADRRFKVSYTKPATGTANKIVDAVGNEAGSFSGRAVARVLVSNIDHTVRGGGTLFAQRAQGFTTGSHHDGYALSSVDVQFTDAPGAGLRVRVVSGSGGSPTGATVATLAKPSSLGTGNQTFTAPAGTTLAADTEYFVVLDSTTTGGLPFSSSHVESGAAGWTVKDVGHSSTGAWVTSSDVHLIRVNGLVNPLQSTYLSAEVIGTDLRVGFDGNLDTGSVPAPGDFEVTVDGTRRTVSSVAVSGATLTLTLASAVTAGQAVTVRYTKPATNPLRSVDRVDVADFFEAVSQVVVSNIGQTADSSADLASVNVAQLFTTGTNATGYELVRVDVGFGTAPSTDVRVRVVEPASGAPTGTTVATLTNPSTLSTAQFTPPAGTTLAANTSYYVVVDSATSGTVSLSSSDSDDAGAAPGWTVADASAANQKGGSTWTSSSAAMLVRVLASTNPVVPAFAVAGASGTTVTLTFDTELDASSVPAPGDFHVTVDGTRRNVAAGGVAISGRTVTLTLASAVTLGQTVTVRYTKPANNPLRGAGGGQVPTFGNQAVDTTGPSFSSARVDGDKLTIAFDEPLGAAASLANDAFAVTKTASGGGDTAVSLSSTAPSISGDSVVLTLASAVALTDRGFKVSYTKPTTGTANKIVDAHGHEAANFSGQSVALVLVSNIDQTVHSLISHRLFSTAASAQAFVTGPSAEGYALTSIDVKFHSAPGSNLRVRVETTTPGGLPTGMAVATLTNPPTLAAGNLTFRAPAGTTLAANGTYSVVLDTTTTGAVSLTRESGEDSGGQSGWSVRDDSGSRTGGTWSGSNTALLIRVNGHPVDTMGPTVSSARVAGDKLTLVFNETLGAAASLANDAFAVTKTASDGTDTSVSLHATTQPSISGDSLVLTLASALGAADRGFKVSYTKPPTGTANKIVDVVGNEAASFSDRSTPRVLVSNIGQTSTSLGASLATRRAQFFRAGSTAAGYSLSGVTLKLDPQYSLPNLGASVTELNDQGVGSPGDTVATLTNSSSVEGRVTFTAPSGTTLEAGGTYVFVLDNTATGRASQTDSTAEDPDGASGWSIADASIQRSGSSWNADANLRSLQVRILGDPLPPAPAVTGVAVSSTPSRDQDNSGSPETYGLGEKIQVQVTFDKAVAVDTAGGTPRLKIKMDPAFGEKWADYESGSGTTTLTFGYTVVNPNISSQGIAVLENTLEVNGGTIKDAANASVDANLAHAGLGHDANHKVDYQIADSTAPTFSSATVNGATLAVVFNEDLDEASVPAASAFSVTVAAQARSVSSVAVADATVTLTLASAVTGGQSVSVSYTTPGSNPLQDASGNDVATFPSMSVTNNTPGSTEPPGGGGGGSGGGGGGGVRPNEPPVSIRDFEPLTVDVDTGTEVDLSRYFRDPERRALTYTAVSSDEEIVTVTVEKDTMVVHGVGDGTATVEVTATDSHDKTVKQTLEVTVGYLVSFATTEVSGREGGVVALTVSISRARDADTAIDYVVSAEEEEVAADAADHDAESGSLTLAAGDTEVTLAIAIHDDEDIEPPRETFTVTLQEPVGAAVALADATARVTIDEGVCDRTPQIQDGVRRSKACHLVDQADLEWRSFLWLYRRGITTLKSKDLMGLSNLRRLMLANNRIRELPEGFFEGLSQLTEVRLADNPGAPFPLTLVLERIDADLPAPGPASIRASLREGAPLELLPEVTVTGGEAIPASMRVAAGALESNTLSVMQDGGSPTRVTLAAPELPVTRCGEFEEYRCFDGIELRVTGTLTLFKARPEVTDPSPRAELGTDGDSARLDLSDVVRAADGGGLRYVAVSGDPSLLTVEVTEDGVLRLRSSDDAGEGEVEVTVTATDEDGLATTFTFTVTIRYMPRGLLRGWRKSWVVDGMTRDAGE